MASIFDIGKVYYILFKLKNWGRMSIKGIRKNFCFVSVSINVGQVLLIVWKQVEFINCVVISGIVRKLSMSVWGVWLISFGLLVKMDMIEFVKNRIFVNNFREIIVLF